MKITICGSLSACDQIMKVKKDLERDGHEVLIPESIVEFSLENDGDVNEFKSEKNNYLKIKPDFMRAHFDKIDKSDSILVVNTEKRGIENYIGGNTFAEMVVAFLLNKKIFLLNPLPEHEKVSTYKEEMIAMNPTVLNGDLSKIESS